MTIKELENKTGMTRANIRFYEGEGLLSPKRLDNGYRDYSEADALTLEKIKLLRQLQLDIDTIRKVQKGALTLEQALFTQMTKLEGDKAVIERAVEVCRELERSRVEYAALDPQPWLRQLQPPQPLRLPPPAAPVPEQDDTPRACRHPWQRWLARMLDLAVYRAVLGVPALVFLRSRAILSTGLAGWCSELLLLVLAMAVEPFWLHFWGWTPGKWVFGLKLRDEHGEKLTLAQGFQRSRAVFVEGYGLDIPGYGLWRFWKCREISLEGRDCHWDGENGYCYTKEARQVHPAIPLVLVYAVCMAALLMGFLYTETPVNRGPLTVAEFAENYNYYYRLLRVDEIYANQSAMDTDGGWGNSEADDAILVRAEAFKDAAVTGPARIWDDPQFTVEDGRVVSVVLRWESSHTYLAPNGVRETLALLALSGSAEGTDLFHYGLSDWEKTAEGFNQWEDWETDYRGLHISQHVEYTGYYDYGLLLSAEEGREQYCEKTVTISLIQ